MIAARHVPHVHADLTVVDFASMAIPLPFHPHRMPPPLREAAGIKSDHPIGFPQLLNDLSDQYLDQRPMIPGRGPNELLQDQALDIDQRRDGLGMLAGQVGQQPLEVEMYVALASLGLKSVLIGHNELAEPLHHLLKNVRGNETIAQYFLSPLCPRRGHLFASSPWSVDTEMQVGSD
jgi:hypothetical protein